MVDPVDDGYGWSGGAAALLRYQLVAPRRTGSTTALRAVDGRPRRPGKAVVRFLHRLSAKERGFRGAKGDNTTVIDAPVLTAISADALPRYGNRPEPGPAASRRVRPAGQSARRRMPPAIGRTHDLLAGAVGRQGRSQCGAAAPGKNRAQIAANSLITDVGRQEQFASIQFHQPGEAIGRPCHTAGSRREGWMRAHELCREGKLSVGGKHIGRSCSAAPMIRTSTPEEPWGSGQSKTGAPTRPGGTGHWVVSLVWKHKARKRQ